MDCPFPYCDNLFKRIVDVNEGLELLVCQFIPYISPTNNTMSLLRDVDCLNPRIPKATAAVIFLHGTGETGRDAKAAFQKHLGDRGHSYIKFYFPTAKKRYMKGCDKVTTFWFETENAGGENEETVGKIEDANGVVDTLDKMMKEIEANGIPRCRIGLGGVSQGGIVSLYGVYSKGLKVGAVVTAASPLMFTKQAKYSTTSRIPLLSLYGQNDAVVSEESMSLAWKILREHKIQFTPRTIINCGHNMNEEFVKYMIEWLEMKITISEC